jgi:AcrR family transcriptional regulator
MTDSRERILAEACDLFLSEGLDGFSMRRLADQVGVTAPALYRHFESKECLVNEVLLEALRRMAGYLYRALEGTTPGERLRLAVDGYARFAIDHRHMYQMVFATPDLTGLSSVSTEIEAQAHAISQFWNDRIRDGMDAGLLAPGDPAQVGVTLWAHSHGLISLYQAGRLDDHVGADPHDFLSFYHESVARLTFGLGAACTPQTRSVS